MKSIHSLAMILTIIPDASAHTTYGGVARDLGPSVDGVPGIISGFSAAAPYFKTITNQTVRSDFGWAAGTGAAFGDAHDIKAFRFTLAEAGWATLRVSADPNRGSGLERFLPAFSLYSGLLHTSGGSDYDTAAVTLAYLATLGDPQPRNGAFDALGTWKMGNDAGELSTLHYIGHVANSGFSNELVSASFCLPAGDYSLIIGGGNINGTDATGSYGINVSLAAIPEPSGMIMLVLSGTCFVFFRRRG